ncbi:MAG: Uma2 family endonuclease [Candidatus Latescibacteria bacterium]|jgi:Uma2 family endonuclease|nr:Uma2 family endonuclease [Candidatus Latescibacterota bacterium]MBT4138236.1 Uma2 family endonuclease [Candidatus Latescibacterota bacterium]MBT5829763.1 Uma2 family endonuclease [Candidatus Latescibacterota bacterium]
MSATNTLDIEKNLTLHFGKPMQRLSDQDFFDFCQANPELRIERTSEGDLIIMSPTGGNTGRRNFNLTYQFGLWLETFSEGVGFDSSTGFILPNGAERAPDLSWVRNERWDALTEAERNVFPPLCPDFVAELRSPSDSLSTLKDKMQEYLDNGAQLGWLIDPLDKNIYIYQPHEAVIYSDEPETISGDPTLPGFVLNLQKIWQ